MRTGPKDREHAYTAGQVTRLTGLSYRTLDHWARTRFLEPSVAKAEGTGTQRLYSFQDIVALRVAHELRTRGISTQALRRIVDLLKKKKSWDHPLAEGQFVVVGKDVKIINMAKDIAKEIISVLERPGQASFGFVLDLSQTVRELKIKISRIKAA